MKNPVLLLDGVFFCAFLLKRDLTYFVINQITQLMNEYNLLSLLYPLDHAH